MLTRISLLSAQPCQNSSPHTFAFNHIYRNRQLAFLVGERLGAASPLSCQHGSQSATSNKITIFHEMRPTFHVPQGHKTIQFSDSKKDQIIRNVLHRCTRCAPHIWLVFSGRHLTKTLAKHAGRFRGRVSPRSIAPFLWRL